MRITHAGKGFTVDGLYLALSRLGRLKITEFKVNHSWPGRITVHRKTDYEKIKDAFNGNE